MDSRFCLECKNFEDRMEIDGVVLCIKGHHPHIACPEFQEKFEGVKATASKTRFCIECKNFEDRMDIDGCVLCARGHYPRVSCPEFQPRTTDIFYTYIYWSYLYSSNKLKDRAYLEEDPQKLSLITLMKYFDLGLDYSDFIKCWSTARKIYRQKIPVIAEVLDVALERYSSFGERTNLKRAFSDLITGKAPKEVISGISKGLYRS
ncbi:MAG: hypothetical protein QXP91_12705 [Candidatus Methanomethylicia archaeon]